MLCRLFINYPKSSLPDKLSPTASASVVAAILETLGYLIEVSIRFDNLSKLPIHRDDTAASKLWRGLELSAEPERHQRQGGRGGEEDGLGAPAVHNGRSERHADRLAEE